MIALLGLAESALANPPGVGRIALFYFRLPVLPCYRSGGSQDGSASNRCANRMSENSLSAERVVKVESALRRDRATHFAKATAIVTLYFHFLLLRIDAFGMSMTSTLFSKCRKYPPYYTPVFGSEADFLSLSCSAKSRRICATIPHTIIFLIASPGPSGSSPKLPRRV